MVGGKVPWPLVRFICCQYQKRAYLFELEQSSHVVFGLLLLLSRARCCRNDHCLLLTLFYCPLLHLPLLLDPDSSRWHTGEPLTYVMSANDAPLDTHCQSVPIYVVLCHLPLLLLFLLPQAVCHKAL